MYIYYRDAHDTQAPPPRAHLYTSATVYTTATVFTTTSTTNKRRKFTSCFAVHVKGFI